MPAGKLMNMGKFKYKKNYSRHRRRKASSTIQKFLRSRRRRQRIKSTLKNYSTKKFNRNSSEVIYKSFTILCPDDLLINPGAAAGGLSGKGIACTDYSNSEFRQCFELGVLIKSSTAANGVAIFSKELLNYLELYKQCRIVHGSVTMLKYSAGLSDGNPATGTPPAASIGTTGDKNWVNYLHSVIDTGGYKQVNNLLKISIPANTNVASLLPDEYFANSNTRFQQVSWDTKKSLKTKIIAPVSKSEWSQQRVTQYTEAGPPPVLPAPELTLNTNQPWVDTKFFENCHYNGYTFAVENYQTGYSLGRLPPLSYYGNGFPTRVATNGAIPTPVQTPLFKVLLSITVAFRIPTQRN